MSQVVKSLGGLTPQELGLQTLRDSKRPGLPPTVDTVVSLPNMHGAYDFGGYLGPRSLPLDCAFMARNSYELQQHIQTLAALLIDGNGKPRNLELIYSNKPDRAFTVRYTGSWDIIRLAGLGTFTLPFTAFDPFAYQTEDTLQVTTWDTDMTWESDLSWEDEYFYEITGPVTLDINNFGLLNAKPIFEITGSFTSLSLTVGGVAFTYSAPMTGTLVLDFNLKTAKHNGANALGNTNGMFGVLPVGNSDVIVGGSGINISMDIRFRAKYPG